MFFPCFISTYVITQNIHPVYAAHYHTNSRNMQGLLQASKNLWVVLLQNKKKNEIQCKLCKCKGTVRTISLTFLAGALVQTVVMT